MQNRALKALRKKAKKGFNGYPAATIAFYGPSNRKATKVVVGIAASEEAETDPIQKWSSNADIRLDAVVLNEVLTLIRSHGVKSVVMVEQIIGCPHEEGIDYPEGETCPECPFWKGRDRWTGEFIH